jgi:hypothetical protein
MMTDSISEKEVFDYMLDKEEEKLGIKKETINGTKENNSSDATKDDRGDSK